MDIGLTLTTHGVATRDSEGDGQLVNVPADQMRPVEQAVRAEALGYHSVWLSDHVVTERVSAGPHTANTSGKRAYPDRPIMLDGLTTMAAIASRTSTLRLAPSVHIAPYRHPLLTAHQVATVDVLSGGRMIMAVGVGWEEGEFDALDADFVHRGAVTSECIRIYKQAWTQEYIDFEGRYFSIADVSMDPKPVQDPHPPIWYGGVTPVAARRAARDCDGFYPMFLDAHGSPKLMEPVVQELSREAERIERDMSNFKLAAFCTVRLCDEAELSRRFALARPLLSGRNEQILEDLALFAQYGYSHVTVHLDCPSGSMAEWAEQMEQFAAEILMPAQSIVTKSYF